MPSYLLESGKLFLACAPRDGAVPADFVELAAVEADGLSRLSSQFPTTAGAVGDVLGGFRGDLVITHATQGAAVQAGVDRLRTQMNAVAPAGTNVQLDQTSAVTWRRISATIHEVIGYVYDAGGAQVRHWFYDYPNRPFRAYVCFSFTLREVATGS